MRCYVVVSLLLLWSAVETNAWKDLGGLGSSLICYFVLNFLLCLVTYGGIELYAAVLKFRSPTDIFLVRSFGARATIGLKLSMLTALNY